MYICTYNKQNVVFLEIEHFKLCTSDNVHTCCITSTTLLFFPLPSNSPPLPLVTTPAVSSYRGTTSSPSSGHTRLRMQGEDQWLVGGDGGGAAVGTRCSRECVCAERHFLSIIYFYLSPPFLPPLLQVQDVQEEQSHSLSLSHHHLLSSQLP